MTVQRPGAEAGAPAGFTAEARERGHALEIKPAPFAVVTQGQVAASGGDGHAKTDALDAITHARI